MPFPAGWIIPDWPAPANVRAVCTTRAGGVSPAPYESLNLGDHVGDEPAAVDRNRIIFGDALGARPVFLQQVHGVQTAAITASSAHGITADACLTADAGVACTIMVADCLPILLATADGGAVGAAHAGWRSLAGTLGQGIVESVVARLGGGNRALMAWLGPCIGPEAFEVGPEVKEAFEAADPLAAALFKAHGPGKWLADLQGLARRRLQAAGVTAVYGNDGGREWCTVSNPSRFFSHRRDRISGRFAASIWLA